jgi:imidazolonepropionase-like amidohydrolase
MIRSLLLLAAFPGLAFAAPCHVITPGTVHTPGGPQTGLSVVVDGGLIAAVEAVPTAGATDGRIPWKGRECRWTQADGELAPGFIDVDTQLGLVEIGLEAGTQDFAIKGDHAIHGSHRVADGYDPRTTLVAVARLGGITTALIHPQGGLVSGQIAAVDLAGRTQAEALVSDSVGLQVDLGYSPSFADTLALLREVLQDARAYASDPRAFERGDRQAAAASWIDLQALWPVTRGEVPLWVGADRASELEALVRFSKEAGVRVVVRGAAEGWMVAPQLSRAGIAVVVDPTVYGAGGFDQMAGRPDNPHLLREAGVDVIIATGSSHFSRGLRQLAGNAVRGGMPHDQALAAITSTPARVFGLGRGAIAQGAPANLVLWSGDPLELSSRPQLILVGGAEQALESRQTALRDRYRQLPGSPLPALSLPKQ